MRLPWKADDDSTCLLYWLNVKVDTNKLAIKKKNMCSLGCSDNPQDDPASMDFVTSAANIRAHLFSITMKSRFDVKGL